MSLEDTLAKDTRITFWGRATDYDATAETLPDYRGSERAPVTRAYGTSTVTANAPTKTADWLSTGEPSMTFAGSEGLAGDFLVNHGAFAIIAVCSTPSAASGIFALFGSQDTGAGVRIGRNGSFPYLFTGAAARLGQSGEVVADTKMLMEWIADPEELGRSVAVNGAAYTDGAMTSHTDIDEETTPCIGYTSSDSDFEWTGDLAEFFIVNVPTRSAPWTELGDNIKAYLAAKYSITLP